VEALSSSAHVRTCAACGTELGPRLLVCPACGQLAHSEELKALAARAEAATKAGDPTAALVAWRSALALLPPQSRQHARIEQTIGELTKAVDALPAGKSRADVAGKPRSLVGRWIGAAGAAILFAATKLKLLLLGLTKIGTLFSILVTLGAYWAAFGWKFAAGIIATTYVHEMGHVAWLRRYGMPASAPMFIPGVGAFVRLKQHPVDAREDARIGLAGPMWGLGATLVFLVVGELWNSPACVAIAHVSAWINLFNLVPVWQLDGSRGFRALARHQRWLVAGAAVGLWFLAHDGMLLVIGFVAAWRAFGRDAPAERDRFALMQYVGLLLALSWILLRSSTGAPGP
jgi:Zn-dependent protease